MKRADLNERVLRILNQGGQTKPNANHEYEDDIEEAIH